MRRSLVLAPLLLVCSSCVTTALWEGDPDGEADLDLGLKLLLTPITLLIDVCTYPLQEWWFEDDLDENERWFEGDC